MHAVLRPIFVTLAAAVRHLAPRRLAEHTVYRSKHWPSDGIIRVAYRAAAASVAVVALLGALALRPDWMFWGVMSGPSWMFWG